MFLASANVYVQENPILKRRFCYEIVPLWEVLNILSPATLSVVLVIGQYTSKLCEQTGPNMRQREW